MDVCTCYWIGFNWHKKAGPANNPGRSGMAKK
jgi:hypothetical protein